MRDEDGSVAKMAQFQNMRILQNQEPTRLRPVQGWKVNNFFWTEKEEGIKLAHQTETLFSRQKSEEIAMVFGSEIGNS
jgi:hypothetical protein